MAYYPFNGNANDESGNDNNGTVNGVTNLTTDANGTTQKAYSFSGGNGDYIEVPDNPQLALQDQNSTIASMWFKFNGGVRTCDLIGQSDGSGGANKWMIHCIMENGGHLGEKFTPYTLMGVLEKIGLMDILMMGIGTIYFSQK